jgi:hypothetical protein
MKTDTIIYALTIEDIQNVANQELDRNLTLKEIKSIEDTISEKINWYNAISDSIKEKIIE